MGPRNVRRLVAQNVMPAEYNSKVMKNYKDFYSNIVVSAKSVTVAAN
jgi:soluble lytic murein transglycosylase